MSKVSAYLYFKPILLINTQSQEEPVSNCLSGVQL